MSQEQALHTKESHWHQEISQVRFLFVHKEEKRKIYQTEPKWNEKETEKTYEVEFLIDLLPRQCWVGQLSQRIRHSKLHPNFMAGQHWVNYESFKQ